MPYAGPLRNEPPAVELYNTLYFDQGLPVDGLFDASSARAWVAGVSDRLSPGGSGPGPLSDELIALREAVRDALDAALARKSPASETLERLNRASGRARSSPVARGRRGGLPVRDIDFHGATRADVVLSALAADAIRILTDPDTAALRACSAPGCPLLYVKDHPRRSWCSDSCGNRARQARHYQRVRERRTRT